MRKWTEEEKQFVGNNYAFMSRKEVATTLNRTVRAIDQVCYEHKLYKALPWTREELETIENNLTLSTYDLQKLLSNRSHDAVDLKRQRYGKKLGLPRRQKNYTVNENYFKGSSLDVFYWAGFLGADGGICGNNLRVELQIRDKCHLEKLKDTLGFTDDLKENTRNINKKKRKYVLLRLSSKEIIQDLSSRFNITSNKTYTLEPPNLSEPTQIKAYIAGFIDGDGCIHFREEKKRGVNKIGTNKHLSLHLSGTEMMMSFIKYFFDKNYLPTERRYNRLAKVSKVKNSRAYNYSIGGCRVEEMMRDLVSLDIPLLQRKWSKLYLL